jgi:hypothetical protein
MKIYEHNIETGVAVEREMTEAEIQQWETDQAAAEFVAEAVAQAKADKTALLAKLGISEDEAKLLLS